MSSSVGTTLSLELRPLSDSEEFCVFTLPGESLCYACLALAGLEAIYPVVVKHHYVHVYFIAATLLSPISLGFGLPSMTVMNFFKKLFAATLTQTTRIAMIGLFLNKIANEDAPAISAF